MSVERVKLPMLCSCRGRHVDSQERLRAWAASQGWTSQPERFVSELASVALTFNANLSYDLDQWFRAVATIERYDPEAKQLVEELVVSVECDLLEDGFAELVLWLIENREQD